MEAKFNFASMRKKVFFRLFRIDAKHGNLKRNENGMMLKQNKKEAKNCHHFRFKAKWSEKLPSFLLRVKWSETEAKNFHHFCFEVKWSEIKWNGSKKLPLFLLRSETEAKFFRFDANKMFFACSRIWSETKMKWSENKTKKKRNEKSLEAKQSKNIRSINFALIGSEKFEAKRSGKKNCVSIRNGSHFSSFHFEAKIFFFAKPAHPRQDPVSHHTAMSART
jgi:hypothetical protein